MRTYIFVIFLFFSLGVKGQFNNSLSFDGVNDFVNLNSLTTNLANSSNFTVEFWVKPAPQQNNAYSVFFAINTIFGDLNKLVIRVSGPGDGGISNSVAINIPVGSTNNVICGSIDVLDNHCHHVAYTYNNGINKLYIDGILQGTLNESYTIESTNRISLGQEFDAPFDVLSQLYKGTLDELRVWSSVKSLSEIAATMNVELIGNEPNLLAYYNFNQGTAGGNNSTQSSLVDNSGNGNSGMVLNFSLSGLVSNFIEVICCDFYNNYLTQTNQQFSINTIVSDENCGNADGTIDLSIPIIPNDYSYFWPGINQNGNSVQSLIEGTYDVRITDSQGCFIDTMFTVSESLSSNIPPPTPVAYCQNDTAINIVLTPSAGGTIHWYTDNLMNNEISSNPLPSTSVSGVFYYYFAQEIGGCLSEVDSAEVTIYPVGNLNLGNDTTICFGQTLILNGQGSNSTCLWQDGSVNSTYNVISSGTYWLQQSMNGCVDIDTIIVNYFPEIVLSMGNDTTLCFGEDLTLNAIGTTADYLWSTGEITSSIVVNTAGIYSVQATIGECSKTEYLTVDYINEIVLNLPKDTILCSEKVNYLSVSDDNYQIVWDSHFEGGVYLVEGNLQSVILVEASNECQFVTDSIEVSYADCNCLIYVPNTFTPDGNEFNNVFEVISLCDLLTFDLIIFDRWGEILFESKDIHYQWDGSYKGRLCQTGLYNWKIIYRPNTYNSETKELHGHINIIR